MTRSVDVNQLLEIMRLLRSDEGCPWDRKQTLITLKQYLIEECYEVIDAIDSGDRDALKDELGDLLLQVVFQSQLATEENSFSFQDVVEGICQKLIRRHPHVFADVKVSGSDEVLKNWEAIKKEEKDQSLTSSVVDGIPQHLPAVHKAHQLQKKVSRIGFDWDDVDGVIAKIEEELDEVKEAIATGADEEVKGEVGDLLFSVINLSRFMGYHAEDALNTTLQKFIARFKKLEAVVKEEGRQIADCSIDDLEAIWQKMK